MPEEIATRLAQEIVNSGYTVVSESEVREMESAIRQREITVMTMKIEKLQQIYSALDKLIDKMLADSDAIVLVFFAAALDLQKNVVDALDELNGDLHLEKYPS